MVPRISFSTKGALRYGRQMLFDLVYAVICIEFNANLQCMVVTTCYFARVI